VSSRRAYIEIFKRASQEAGRYSKQCSERGQRWEARDAGKCSGSD